MLQRHPVQKLHGDERVAVLVVNLVDGADVGVIQCRGSLGFALKAAECLLVFGYIVGQELEGDKTTELHILSLIDHTHTAAAQLLDDAIVGYGLPNHWRESYVRCSGRVNERRRVGRRSKNVGEASPRRSPFLYGPETFA